jgi:hypothetical protein
MTMLQEQLIPVPDELNSPQQVEIAGQSGWVSLSPFDFPRSARVVMKEFDDKTRIVLRLLYDVANDEPIDDSIKHSGVALGVGKESGRIFSITISMKPAAHPFRDFGLWVTRVHDCLVDLQNKTGAGEKSYLVRKRAHYKMVESLVPVMAREIDKNLTPFALEA